MGKLQNQGLYNDLIPQQQGQKMTTTKYPDISIPLVGEDGNAFSILGRVSRVMKRNGIHDQWDEFHTEATSGDYDNLLRTVMAWFAVDEDDED
jgi:hypothetical protein